MKQAVISVIRKAVRWHNRYINGIKGSISIFLALVMLPFISIALLLVESARYQSAIEEVDELMDCVGLSTLADYDTYLEDRFGLLALSQKTAVNDTYTQMFEQNENVLNNGFSKTSLSAEGVYPLSNQNIFRQQLFEYSELTAVTKAVYEGINFDELVDKLYEALNLDKLQKRADALQNVADTAKSGAELIDAIVEFISALDTFKNAKSEYSSARSGFINAISDLQEALENAKDNLEPDESEETIYTEYNVWNKRQIFDNARNNFSDKTKEMAKQVGDLRDAIGEITEKANDVMENLSKANSAYDELGEADTPGSPSNHAKTNGDWVRQIVSSLVNLLDIGISDTYGSEMDMQQTLLNDQKKAIDKVVCTSNVVTNPRWDLYDYITPYTVVENYRQKFELISLNSVRNGLADDLRETLSEVDDQSSPTEDERNLITKLLDITADLLKVTVIYDGALDANVSSAAFMNSSTPAFHHMAIMFAISEVAEAANSFMEAWKQKRAVKVLIAIAELAIGIVAFVVAAISWAVEFLVNIFKFFGHISDFGENLLLTAYSVYNLPCRTTYEDGKSLSGYEYKKIFKMFGGVTGDKFSGSLDDLETLCNMGGGSAKGFKGAEMEYVLVGGNNELLNQGAAFFDIFMFRVLVFLATAWSNEGVLRLSAKFNMSFLAAYICMALGEGMIDTLLLVNGEEVYLLKKTFYITPEGIPILLDTLPKLTGLSEETKTNLRNLFSHGAKIENKGFLKMDYQDCVFILMMSSLDQEKLTDRLQNLVQMEAKKNYEDEYQFSLTKSKTMIKARVDGKLNAMFSLKELVGNGLFSFNTTRYSGY